MADAQAAPAPPPTTAPACSRLALGAYLLGLFPTGVLSAPLGVLALRRIQRRPDRVGRPVAWAAIALGVLWLVGIGWLVYLRVASGAAAYERAAIEELRTLRAGQAALRDARVLDADADGRGEFGDLPQLAQVVGVSREYAKVDDAGVVRRFGYCFRCYLPLGVDQRESDFLIYAWPEFHGHPAVRAFLLDGRSGRILACSNATHIAGRYSGLDRIPLAVAAFDPTRVMGAWPLPQAQAGESPADGEDWAAIE